MNTEKKYIIGVISDTHIMNRPAGLPKEMLDDFKKADLLIHAGDLTEPEVLEYLKSYCNNIKAVSGNMDSAEVKKILPEKEIIKVGRYKIGIMHGWGAPDKLIEVLMEEFKDSGVDIIVFGHSHSPLNEKKHGILFFNPGSPLDRVFAPYNSYGIIELGEKIESRIVKIGPA